MKVKPYYKDYMFNTYSKIPAYKVPKINMDDNVKYFDLDNMES